MESTTPPVVRLLDSHERISIMDVFARRFESEMSVQDISESTDIDGDTVQRELDYLSNVGFIKEAEEGYVVVKDSKLVQKFGEMHRTTVIKS